jgi:acetolactate synthase-1/2/3 large subunit
MERGGGLPDVPRLPYFPEDEIAALTQAPGLVLAGAPAPVAFFGYPDLPSELTPPGVVVEALADPAKDAAEALERLADALRAARRAADARSAHAGRRHPRDRRPAAGRGHRGR